LDSLVANSLGCLSILSFPGSGISLPRLPVPPLSPHLPSVSDHSLKPGYSPSVSFSGLVGQPPPRPIQFISTAFMAYQDFCLFQVLPLFFSPLLSSPHPPSGALSKPSAPEYLIGSRFGFGPPTPGISYPNTLPSFPSSARSLQSATLCVAGRLQLNNTNILKCALR